MTGQEIENVDPMLEQILKQVSNLSDLVPKLNKLGTTAATQYLDEVFLSISSFDCNSFYIHQWAPYILQNANRGQLRIWRTEPRL